MNEAEKGFLEVLNSLNIIKDVCIKYDENCEECPLGKENGDCNIISCSPDCWDINEKTITRLL